MKAWTFFLVPECQAFIRVPVVGKKIWKHSILLTRQRELHPQFGITATKEVIRLYRYAF
jgi:hypothetical protein